MATTAASVLASNSRKIKRNKWNDGLLDFSMLNVLGDFAKSFEYNTIPSVPDLEMLVYALMQQEAVVGSVDGAGVGSGRTVGKDDSVVSSTPYSAAAMTSSMGGAAVTEAGMMAGVGTGISLADTVYDANGAHGGDEGGRSKRPRLRKGYDWADEQGFTQPLQFPGEAYTGALIGPDGGDVGRSFYGRATKGYAARLGRAAQNASASESTTEILSNRPLNLERTRTFFRSLETAAPQDYQQIVVIMETVLGLYRQRTVDHYALAALLQALLKDHVELLREIFTLTSPDDHIFVPKPGDSRAIQIVPTWIINKDDQRKVPLAKKAPIEKTGSSGPNAAARLEQASRMLGGPAEEFAKHFLIRARIDMGEHYPWLLDNLVAMRMSLRAQQYVALEKRAATVLKTLPESLRKDFSECFPICSKVGML